MEHNDNIRIINSTMADYIIKNREPRGLFIYCEKGWYVGIDNRTGDAWTEDFRTKMGCLSWLTDEMTTDEVHDKENANYSEWLQGEDQ